MPSPDDLKAAQAELDKRYLSKALKAHFRKEFRARLAHTERATTWLNVLGTAIGERLTNGHYTGQQAVIAYVAQKVRRAELSRTVRIPSAIDGIPVDVIRIGRPRATASNCIPHPDGFFPRPFPAGVSIGGGTNAAGTFGCLVRRGGTLCLLSNYHVLGDMGMPGRALPLRQPGFGDGAAGAAVGQFLDGLPLVFTGAANPMDAAIAQVDPTAVRPDIVLIGGVTAVGDPIQDMPVAMHGKASHFNRGIVVHTSTNILVTYGTKQALLVGQVRIVPQAPDNSFGEPGDSGAVIVRDGGVAVALMVAREFVGGRFSSIATPLPRVFEALRLTLPT
jgi:hypothetical protein